MLGYLIITLKEEGKGKKEIKEVVSKLSKSIDSFTEIYAEKVHDGLYGLQE